MRDLLTPKQVARAIDVSESSVKRWCDKGHIRTQYTAGGHRRIDLAALMEFLRQHSHRLVHPEALGLPPTSGQSGRVVARAKENLTAALINGDDELCRQIAFDLFLANHSVSVMREIGVRWACGEAEVYEERRGCEISLRTLHELRSLVPAPHPESPLAIGGAVEGDQYNLGTTMAELVLRGAGWQATSLGDNLPFATLAAAIRKSRPKLFWLSCSHICDSEHFLTSYSSLYDEFSLDVAFVVGGYALDDGLRRQMKFAAYCDNMQHLEGFAQTLRAALQDEASGDRADPTASEVPELS